MSMVLRMAGSSRKVADIPPGKQKTSVTLSDLNPGQYVIGGASRRITSATLDGVDVFVDWDASQNQANLQFNGEAGQVGGKLVLQLSATE